MFFAASPSGSLISPKVVGRSHARMPHGAESRPRDPLNYYYQPVRESRRDECNYEGRVITKGLGL